MSWLLLPCESWSQLNGCDKIILLRRIQNHDIFLICTHMAHNTHFWVSCKMCLMGDIEERIYFSPWDSTHLFMCFIRFLPFVLIESLHFHYKEISTFLIFFQPTIENNFSKIFWKTLIFKKSAFARWGTPKAFQRCTNGAQKLPKAPLVEPKGVPRLPQGASRCVFRLSPLSSPDPTSAMRQNPDRRFVLEKPIRNANPPEGLPTLAT